MSGWSSLSFARRMVRSYSPADFPGGRRCGGRSDNLGILLGVRLAQFDESGVRLAKLQIIKSLVGV
ncbi:MAG: hypothetical protein Ct9H300mP32_4740 [Verrucomicrobiota bacterium]|nr:MAG: hypothetical protein Ct9H300mP32_4740 [Verrucomicrobiota bacterium]